MQKPAVSRRSIGARQNPEAAAAILDAAADLLRREGLKGLTFDAIAREARASKTTLYRWWPNRGALLLAIYLRIKGEHSHPDTGSVVDDVAQTLARVFAAWRNEGGIFALIIAEAQHDEAVAESLRAFREDRIAGWQVVLQRAVSRGELTADADLPAIAESILAHAWLYLLTDRLDSDPLKLASDVMQPWLRRELA
jgi:AcrR family transcriptional regulator